MSVLGNMNYMKRFVHHPCATPNPIMLIEFAFEAGLPVLFELLSADILDKALKQGKDAWRKAASGKNRSPQPPDGNTGPQSGHGRKAGGRFGRRSPGRPVSGREWLFDLVDMEQTGMYWWLVADLATEFLARWSTLIYLKQGCPFDHECFAQGLFNSIYIGQGEVNCFVPVLSTGVVSSGGYVIQQTRKGKFSVTYNAQIFKVGTHEPASAARVELRGGVGAGRTFCPGDGGGVDYTGARMSGGFHNFDHDSGVLSSYNLVLVNDSPTETVGVEPSLLCLSSGFCNNSAPSVPWDSNHLVPQPHGRFGVH